MSAQHEHAHRPGERPASASEQQLLQQVLDALQSNTPLAIQGANSKAFLGRPVAGEVLDTRQHSGIVNYDPTELVVTVRSGTPLVELFAALDEQGQTLTCEPPTFGGQATVGGMVAAGLSGPRRPWSGAVRDLVLGTRVITGQGKLLRFGGEVMKNVAGYDLSRLMAASFGQLGVITEVSMKVLPKPVSSHHLRLELPVDKALLKLAEWGQQPIPITAASYLDGHLHLRLEGGIGSVRSAADRIGGEELDAGFWAQLNEQQLAFFQDPRPLWRLSLPPLTPALELPGDTLLDWAGAQRWLKSAAAAEEIQALASRHGGHATCYTAGVTENPFQPLAPLLQRYHRQLKKQLDPQGLFNPGRLYSGL
ncbi:glycolate oxidase FAD binding subunit [Pseudomonas saudimassiliensis]|uniref:Glycolate oxidase FAD binding subunit n=1 Tax=Pseudomonas saudimassiliensis TaxID=1461581 RepID=A0A078MFB9_9PSED|nr:glycolate oxidase subunit GlcE [Pseudomonas saudimassiliensis]CEA04989.1 glycolate oxidase FAD binding subunit [Pseudomonas saudimassiliensis]CEF26899.1 glycolate oxidase FAD binding subunit [Pseudomonas saudimassiliensis]